MLKLIKYEFKRNIATLIILYAVIAGLEAFSLYGMFAKNRIATVLSLSLLVLGGFSVIIFIFVMAIQSYSRELSSKYSYMIFMTPNSTYKIIGSKLFTTGLIALFTTVVAGLLIVLDFNIFISQFTDVQNVKEALELDLSYRGLTLGNIYISILVYCIVVWIEIFMWICLAYFAITLSATAFSNKKFRGLFSFMIFIGIAFAISYFSSYLPDVDIGSGLVNTLLTPLYSYLVDIVAIIGAFLVSSLLLDKKVSL